MSSSLDQLTRNLPDDAFMETTNHFSDQQLFSLVRRKGVFPYEYISGWDKLDETSLPQKESFFSSLYQSDITDEEYRHAQHVWRAFQCKNIGEYSDIYLKTDVLLLTDVYERFRDVTMASHKVDPAH